MSREMFRGVSRGMFREVSRGMFREVSRGMFREVSRGMFREVSRGMFRLRPAPGRVLHSDSSGLRSKSVQPGFGGHGRVDPQRT